MRLTRPALLLFLLSCLLFFFVLGNHQLQGSTESRVAGIAMEMHLNDDWVTPRLLGEPFLEKPPLSLWLDAGAIRLFGATPLAVRLAAAFAGLFSVMLLYTMLRKLGRPTTIAWGAAAMLATMASFWSNSRSVGEDALLSLGVTMALLAFFKAGRQQAQRPQLANGYWWLFTLGIVIATLSKGVLGLALTGVVIFVYLVCESLIDKRFTLSNWIRPALFTLLGLIPLMIWLGLLYQRGGLQAVGEVLWANSVGRFSGSFVEAGHYEHFYYYLAKLPQAFLPWNLLVYFGLWHFRKSLRSNPYLLFLSIWIVAQFILLSLASSKRMVYLMSMTPAAAVIASEYARVLLERLRTRSGTSPLAAKLVKHRWGLACSVLAFVVCSYLTAGLLAPRGDSKVSFKPVTEHLLAQQAAGKQVALFQPGERLASIVFYSGRLPRILQSEAELKTYLDDSSGNVAIIDGQPEQAKAFKLIQTVTVNGRSYYFVEH